MSRNILLLEPNYKNKYPPIGLMKIATYYRNQGDNVVFYKGDLKVFIINQITQSCINKLIEIDNSINWNEYKVSIFEYIRTRKKQHYQKIETDLSNYQILIDLWLNYYKNFYFKKEYLKFPQWDRVCVTTLFTFYWDITIETIEFAKTQVKDLNNLLVGGIMSTILADDIEAVTGIKPYKGTLCLPEILDKGNDEIIDELPLDYSILDEIDYKYPETNAFYGYTTRGCIRNCPFCAVPTLEPNYEDYIPLKPRIDGIREKFGDQKDLLLMDNNVLASENFSKIIDDIKSCGFTLGSKFTEPNLFEISIKNLRNSLNDNAYIRKTYFLIKDLSNKVKVLDAKQDIYKKRKEYGLLKLETCTKDNLINSYDYFAPLFEKYKNKVSSLRHVDFNQGVDSRLFTYEKVRLLSDIPVRPLRIAFDSIKELRNYEKAIRLSVDSGIKDFSNYLLYNFKDKPIDLYQRLKFNIELCEELNISIYSFPMKYHPINGKFSHNRDYIGKHWNRKYIRAVQAIVNSTKGKIGRGKSFFYKAFGNCEEEFYELLEMPETFILYRFFFEWLSNEEIKFPISTMRWKECFYSLNDYEKNEALILIHSNKVDKVDLKNSKGKVQELLSFYSTNYRKEIITPGYELYELKKLYDENPIFILKGRKKMNNLKF